MKHVTSLMSIITLVIKESSCGSVLLVDQRDYDKLT